MHLSKSALSWVTGITSLIATSDATPLEKRVTTSPAAPFDGCLYQVSKVGAFNSRIAVTNWSKFPFTLKATDRTGGPARVRWNPANVGVDANDGSLTLTVPGGQATCSDDSPCGSAQITTAYDDIMYGSMRTVAKTPNVWGTVSAMFFYSDDNNEADIEIQTGNTTYAHFTNQDWYGDNALSNSSVVADTSAAYHEYRIDWVPGRTDYYVDGKLLQTYTKFVPRTSGYWMWNSWTNAGYWTYGPPAKDAVLHIKSIDVYFNRTSITTCGSAS
ncbi:concanavalin A-like lectin/glucanase [Aureobasidium pullulans]|nr:concanavalin A-like lectin/glucanase [Aureobasidium pullulans]THZ59266.1 concanavalin A-like lectin/glucanase [Aureobasidium pullulans]